MFKQKMKQKSFFSAVALSTALIFSTSAVVTPPTIVSAATQDQKAALLKNQTDFYNFFAYDAVLLKNIVTTAGKIEKLQNDANFEDPKFLTDSKKYLSEFNKAIAKMKKISSKNKDITAINKKQIEIMSFIVDFYTLTIKVVETKDEELANELLTKLETFQSDLESKGSHLGSLTEKVMKKYKLKMNASIQYFAFGTNAEKISLKSFTYTVNSGDDLSKIAKAYGVSSTDIKKWNKLKSSKLKQGQKLKIEIKL